MKDYIALDLETSGFSPTNNEILEVGAIKVQNGVVTDKYSALVKPMGYVGRNVLDVTGLTLEELNNGENCEDVLLELHDFCGSLPFLGHNIGFDYRFLVEKGKHVGVDFSLNKMRRGIDTLKLARKLLNLDSNKLVDVANALSINLTNVQLHRALNDALVCKLVYEHFCIMFESALFDISCVEYFDKDAMKYGGIVNNDELDFK